MTINKTFYPAKFDEEFTSKNNAILYIKDILASRDSQRKDRYELEEFNNKSEIKLSTDLSIIKLSNLIFFIINYKEKYLLFSTGAGLDFSDIETAIESLEEFQEMVPGIWKIFEVQHP